jgi:hypothetical protein
MKTLAQWLGERPSAGVPRTLPIYEQQRLPIRPEDVKKLASRFGVQGRPQRREDTHLLCEGKKVVIAHGVGPTFFYADYSKLDNPRYRPKLPSEEEAKAAALSYLKENGWLPRNAVVDAVRSNQFERIEGRGRARKLQFNNICVDLRLSLGPLNTYGPGAKIKVFLGAKDEVIGLFHAVPRLRKVAEVRLTPPRSLEKVLRQKFGLPPEQIELKNATLAYIVDSALSGNRLVQPAFVLTLATMTTPKRSRKPVAVEFMTHPLSASRFAPMVTIEAPRVPIDLAPGTPLRLSCAVQGGKVPYKIVWESNIDGVLGVGRKLEAKQLSTAHRERQVVCHTIKATVTDANGMQDSHSVLVRVRPSQGAVLRGARPPRGDVPGDPFVGVEWCNLYNGAPGLADISGTDTSAQGFKARIQSLPGWSSRFDWGNDAAWEQDFKFLTAPSGGTDSYWADNVHFAFFAGHGSSGAFYFGSQADDHQILASDARWGDGILNWIVLHACQTMRANFAWDVWCDSFRGLHEMFGFHTNTEGSTPPLGSRFAFWASCVWPFIRAFDLRTGWRLACSECFDTSVENAVIYADQSGTDTQNDHLPGFGFVSADPISPNVWVYSKQSC